MTKNLGPEKALAYLLRRGKCGTPGPYNYPAPPAAPWLRPTGAWLRKEK